MENEIKRRMKKLKIMDETISQYFADGVVTMSEEVIPGMGILYWANEREKEAIESFEKRHKESGAKIYHGLRIHTNEGDIAYFLYITNDYKDDGFDSMLADNIIHIYCNALDTTYFSEYGTTYVIPSVGGLAQMNPNTEEHYKKLKERYPFK